MANNFAPFLSFFPGEYASDPPPPSSQHEYESTSLQGYLHAWYVILSS